MPLGRVLLKMERNLDIKPYSSDEQRVCDYLQKILKGQIGCGDDPIGFLITSHIALSYELKRVNARINNSIKSDIQ